MLHCVLVADATEAVDLFERLIALVNGQVKLDRVFASTPPASKLYAALNTLRLDAFFLEVSSGRSASVYWQIRKVAPTLPVIGFSIASDDFTSVEDPHLYTLERPFSPEGLLRTLTKAVHARRPQGLERLHAFIPAKAGSGATTVLLNAAGELSRTYRQQVLVLEADLRSGVLSVVINATPENSILDVLHSTDQLQTLIWDHHVVKTRGIDFLLSKREKTDRLPQWHDYYHLLQFLTPRYERILVDLPEVINEATVEVVLTAQSVFVVVTPELPSVRLAERRLEELKDIGVAQDRVKVLLNRWHSSGLRLSDIEDALQQPVAAVFPNDYPAVMNSIINAAFVDPNTELGQAYRSFAGFLIGTEEAPFPPKEKVRAGVFRGLRLSARRS